MRYDRLNEDQRNKAKVIAADRSSRTRNSTALSEPINNGRIETPKRANVDADDTGSRIIDAVAYQLRKWDSRTGDSKMQRRSR